MELRTIEQVLGLLKQGDYLGEVHADMEKLLQELADFCDAYSATAKGSLSIKLDFTRDRHGQIEIKADHTIKAPKNPTAKAIAWSTVDGALTIANPMQRRMDIRDATDGSRHLVVNDD